MLEPKIKLQHSQRKQLKKRTREKNIEYYKQIKKILGTDNFIFH